MDENERYIDGVSRADGWLTFYRVDRELGRAVIVGVPDNRKRNLRDDQEEDES